jgi:hypothetical protein
MQNSLFREDYYVCEILLTWSAVITNILKDHILPLRKTKTNFNAEIKHKEQALLML